MSLSFVTKAIQTTAADGTYEEQAVRESEDDKKRGSTNTRGGIGAGLFDQLRQNKEEEEASRLEFQRSIMRGTLALDEDDAAHLQELQKQKETENAEQERHTQSQIMFFRAAQAERMGSNTTTVEVTPNTSTIIDVLDSTNKSKNTIIDVKKSFIPSIKIKKRKRHENDLVGVSNAKQQNGTRNIDKVQNITKIVIANEKDTESTEQTISQNTVENNPVNGGNLSSLLSGYSSDESG